MKENKITILKDGKQVICDVLFTIDDNINDCHYVIYTDNVKDKNGNITIDVSKYSNDGKELLAVSNEDEKKLIEKVIKIVEEEINKLKK